MCFASGVIFGIVPAYGNGPYGPPAETGYYGGPPPSGHPEISQAMSELQHARYVLQAKAASDYHGHKANAVGFIDNAINELQICMSMP
jgi:hypothetical protein